MLWFLYVLANDYNFLTARSACELVTTEIVNQYIYMMLEKPDLLCLSQHVFTT